MCNRHGSGCKSSSDSRSPASLGCHWGRTNWATVSLICLVLQNLSLIHFLKESRVEGHPPYSSAEAVVVCEVFTALDAVTFQILYQFKILTLAFFLRICMRRTLRPLQVASLVLLMAGIILTQTANAGGASAPLASPEEGGRTRRVIAGACVLLAAVSSGFAGVYTEMILKGKMGPAEPGPAFARAAGRGGAGRCEAARPPASCLFVKNAQMSALGVLFGAAAWVQADGARSVLRPRHLLAGWTGAVWMAVLTGAVGGLIISAVMKYADNMLKTFATSVSIVASMCASIAAGDTPPDARTVAGIAMVVFASVAYARESRAQPPPPPQFAPFQHHGEKTSGNYQALG
ncbi:MAG: nucleotide-sugar transporter-domain-containing protein, partial [Olpidium bornovanus]